MNRPPGGLRIAVAQGGHDLAMLTNKVAAAYGRASSQPAKWLIFVVWWGLLVSEEVFSYRSDIAGGAGFSSQAYDQATQALVDVPTRFFDTTRYVFSLGGGVDLGDARSADSPEQRRHHI